MHRRGLFGDAQVGQVAKKRVEARARAGHHRLDRQSRAGAVAGQREDEAAHPLRRQIAAIEQWLERVERALAVPPDGQAECQPTPRFVARRAEQRQSIVRLRRAKIAEQVARHAAIERDACLARTKARGLVEITHRALRIAHLDHRRAEPDLGRGHGRIAFLGTAEEARRRLRIAQFERGATGTDQCSEIARADRQLPKMTHERIGRAFDIARNRRRPDCGRAILGGQR